MKKLTSFDRVSLGHFPTPIEPLARLSAELSAELGGPQLYIKRDDCTGLGLGGNKVRKLEFLAGRALAEGADTLITVGALQSNHARQTAAAAAKLGLKCHLILPKLVPREGEAFERSGNPLLDRLFGAEVHVVDTVEEAMQKGAEVNDLVAARGGKAYFIPSGGSNEIGLLGFIGAAHEVVAQEKELGFSFDRIVLGTSTGGTVAGLAFGFEMEKSKRPLEAVMVYEPSDTFGEKFRALVDLSCSALDVTESGCEVIEFIDGNLGDGYGLPTEAMREAVQLMAECEGILLDPVYTGKAMAGLIDRIRQGRYSEDEKILFWHTGGTPALFAYAEVF